MDMSQCAKYRFSCLMFLLAEHLDLNQIIVGSKVDVHMMTGRTGISSELLLYLGLHSEGFTICSRLCSIAKQNA